MKPNFERLQQVTRRNFLMNAGQFCLGTIAFAGLLRKDALAGVKQATNPLAPRNPHFEPKVKRVIYLHMSGGPPHLDLFDYKPDLVEWNDKPCPDTFLKGKRFAFTTGVPKLMGTPREFGRYGQGGIWMSDAISRLHDVADELCVIRSMTTDQFNHAPAELLL